MTDFATWDKKATALVCEAEAEEAEEKAKSDQALGLDGKPKGPPVEKAEKELAELSELSEAKKAILRAHGCMPGQEDPRELVLRVQEPTLEELRPEADALPGKAVRFVGVENGRLRVPEVRDGEKPVLKIFVDGCKGCSLQIEAKLSVGVLELFNCENLTTEVLAGPLPTVQADNCRDCLLGFQRATDLGAVYHAGCPGLRVRAAAKAEPTLVAPKGEDGEPDPRQHVTRVLWGEKLDTTLVIRHAENQYPTNLATATSREEQAGSLDSVSSSLRSAAALESVTAPASGGGYPLAAAQAADLAAAGGCPPQQLQERLAEKKKQEGNEAFKNSDFVQAAALYTEALQAAPDMHLALANRAQCFLKMGDPEKALKDAESCIEVCPADFSKGHFRKGMALRAMERYGEAVQAYVEAERRDPKNKQIPEAIKFAGMMARKQAQR